MLHDIGKIGIPDRILLKPDKLTDTEWAEMRRHTLIGYRMCSRIEMLKTASEIVKHHHERWDGKGYPEGLKGEEIPLGARLFALSDTLDAMTVIAPIVPLCLFLSLKRRSPSTPERSSTPRLSNFFLSIPASRWMYIRTLSTH